MVFWFFSKKKFEQLSKKFDKLHGSLNFSFENIKNDMTQINDWVKHFKGKHGHNDKTLELLNMRINNIEEVLQELREKQTAVQTAVQTPVQTGGLSKQPQTDSCPNTLSKPVQTAVQTENTEKVISELKNLTMMERAVIWALLNTDLKLSYDDLSVALGKDKSTLRGQINSLKQKSEKLIQEMAETDGKKRFYINEDKKQEILKKTGLLKQKVAKKTRKQQSESTE